ncbi:MAG: penicillin-binding protein 2 [Bifidobacteriaceae bacterium]|jgi:peptidoglycan glycosyltransferase|nr:penicillin-binding protein 2 [Bifidobacteriaceae bacterium]
MNAQIRRVAALTMVMFLALFGIVTFDQFINAPALRADPHNSRMYYASFNKDRGPIIVGGDAVAASVPVDDDYGYQRTYAQGPLYAPITGYYSISLGMTGLEWTSDEILQGTSDSLFLTRIQDLITGSQPQGGAVELTIHPAAQQAAYEGLGDQRGAAIALDVDTGEILAMASTPSFDPAVLAAHNTTEVQQAYDDLLADSANPLWNRTIAGNLYAPGSTFKLITAAAALETGRYDPDTQLDAPSRLELPDSSAILGNMGDSACSSTGTMTLAEALAISCNTAFASLGLELGDDVLRAQAERFGFGKRLDVPLPVTPSVFPPDPDRPQTAMSAIGQFDDRVTPLQMAMVVSAIAGDGVLRTPHLVRTERGSDLEVVATTPVTTLAKPLSPESAEDLADMMVRVVENGTGGRVAIPGVRVGGKTGTAEKGEGKAPDNWFVAFGETDDQAVAVAVVVEDGGKAGLQGTGGAVAGPIARAVMEAVLDQ